MMLRYMGWILSFGFLLGLAIGTLGAQPPRTGPAIELLLDWRSFERLKKAIREFPVHDEVLQRSAQQGAVSLILDELTVRQLLLASRGAISAHEADLDREARKVNRRVNPTVPPTPRPGDTVILQGIPGDIYLAMVGAFAQGKRDHAGPNVTVRMEVSQANYLLYLLSTSMGTNFVRK